MKILQLLFPLLLCIQAEAQNLELFAGVGVNHFFDKGYDDGHYRSTYSPGLAKSLGLGLYGKTGLGIEMGITLKYMEIEGGIDVRGGGLGYGFGLDVNSKLKSLELGLYPLNIYALDKRFEVRLGMEFAFLLGGEMLGKQTGWYLDYDYNFYPPRMITVSELKPIDSTSDDYISDLSAFVCLKIGYLLPIRQKLELVPRLHLGYGLSKRFTDKVDSMPKNWVGMLEIAARRKF
ncbi:MAG: hypothetical protein IT258_20895 [Saprospiraceae bacterium]|nr:hypothetical protein [Saprospiraceae bacterium]